MRFHKTISNFLLSSALIAAATTTTWAADLQERLVVDEGVIRLSDIFTDTGIHGDEIIMEAPAPGKRTQLSNYQLTQLAEKYELDWNRPAYLKRIYIERGGIPFKGKDLQQLVMNAIRNQGVESELNVRIHGRVRGMYLPTDATFDDVYFEEFEINDQRTRFTANMILPTGTKERSELRISGAIEEVRLIPMLNSVVGPGEIITADHISWVRYPVKRINRNTIQSSKELIGHTVRRAQQSGKALIKNDIRVPVTVTRGSTVTMQIRAGKMLLTAEGRALEEGGKGDVIRVMNEKSHTSVNAKIIHAGLVEVQSNSTKLVASR
ncbi:flagellar basal body P-ring formation chaperone FlgA [Kordiimonas laminariae]|uniref:flagellar basal body P-ring formation chaperone FlgA n=1 Tax=Kordiimonas laminariae TaxID=2917717 RepID=UPI001FF0F715|nr:flagellar basal body P-ring formation chaperone FlgA [Kordiimonas laminariae]MCK0070470.1 flagellar basal body P-ring formation chaperone FlgA [Kordiimonas laminariae]